jgi:hypothetical protein
VAATKSSPDVTTTESAADVAATKSTSYVTTAESTAHVAATATNAASEGVSWNAGAPHRDGSHNNRDLVQLGPLRCLSFLRATWREQCR